MTKSLPKTAELRDADEIGAPNTERVGLWKILAISTTASVASLAAVAAVV